MSLLALAAGPAFAQQASLETEREAAAGGGEAQPEEGAQGNEIVVTAARTALPPSALPLTIDVIDNQTLTEQIAISGSVTDAVANLT
ncbi:MAG TPA: TonB-dependent receptor, partial [Allosphingosinicella sp.]